MTQWYFNPVGNYWLVAGLALLLVLALALLRLPRGRLSDPRRRALFALRAAILLLTLMALLRPTLIHSEVKNQSATLVLLVDRSRSMLVRDAFGGKSRWEAIQASLADAAAPLQDLAKDIEVKAYGFDEQLEQLELSDGKVELSEEPTGQQSAIGAAMEDVLRQESGKRLLGIVLLSDGAQRAYAPRDIPPQTPARRMGDLGYPLYTLTFGEARGLGQARDVALKDLVVNQTVFVKNQLAVFGTARIEGFANQKIPVQLLFESSAGKMQVVGSEDIVATQSGQSLPVELSYVPQTPGEYKLTLKTERQPGEMVTTNNEISTFVTVLKGGLNVLYVEGTPRVEQNFLWRSLDGSPDIKMDFIRLERGAKTRPADLEQRFQRGKYDVYMIGDVDSSLFTASELQALARVVQEGAGLVMLGGFHAFGPGGYADTPLASVLPVEMDTLERQRFEEKIRSDVHLSGPVKMRPARPLGLKHFVMALAGDNQAAWDRLPALEGANKLAPKRSARVLAETDKGAPLLVADEAGGRVMAFAADSTWHWWMGDKTRDYQAEHKRFWRQVILWLARKDEQTDNNVWLKLSQRRFAPGGRVEFTAGAVSPQGEPLADATLEVEIIPPEDGPQRIRAVREGNQWSGVFTDTQTAGDYTIQVSAERNGAAVGKTKARFLVFKQDLELDNPAADPTLLSSLAAMTKQAGGQALAPEELPALVARLKQQPRDLEVEREVKDTPWDTWPFFLAFVALASCEWYLRKQWGLV